MKRTITTRPICWTLLAVLAAAALPSLLGMALAAEEAAPAKAETDWPHWRGPGRDAISPETDWKADWAGRAKDAWHHDVGEGYSAVSVRDGLAVTMGFAGGKDTVWAFDAATGERKWQYAYPSSRGNQYHGPRGTPAMTDKFVFTHSVAGLVHGLDISDGKKVWSVSMPKQYKAKAGSWGFAGSPLLLGDRVIIDAGVVVAFDQATGKEVWKSEHFPAGYSTPAVFQRDGKTYLACFNAYGLVILDAADGKTLGTLRWQTAHNVNAATPIVEGEKVFISSGYGKGCALVDMSGSELRTVYTNKNMANHFNTCVLVDGYLYGFSGQAGGRGRLVCMKMADGKVAWSQRDRAMGTGSLIVAGDRMIVQGERGVLMTLKFDNKGVKGLARAQALKGICWTMPVLANDRIYVRSSKGLVRCYDVSKDASE